MSDPQPLYSVTQAAALLGKAPVTVRMLARTHNIGRKVGAQYVFTGADLEKLRSIPGPGRPRLPATARPRRKPKPPAT